jgi:O-antigen ligase
VENEGSPMKPPAPSKSASGDEPLAKFYGVLFGAFLGVTLLKFSNVAIFEKLVERPANGWEWAINAWPVSHGYWLLGALAVAGAAVARWEIHRSRWLVALPLAWVGWQLVSATHTVDPALTRATVKHFAGCVTCFYLGFFALGRLESPLAFLSGLIVALALVIAVGFEQHFGGLEESRRYFFTYVYPQMPSVPPEYLKKISSTRIFSTLFYPNALAGALLMLMPAALVVILKDLTWLTIGARRFVAAVVGGGGLACLFWSGSKGGWLLMLLLGLIALLRLPFARRWKLALVGLLLVAGLMGFGLKYAGFFRQGATSVSARFDYWQAAARTAVVNPLFGTGPGTFAIPYQKIKRPESEMAKLVHNDYLQQASDSGFVGLALFGAFVVGVLIQTKPRSGAGWASVRFAVWLGLLGWWLQGFLEFGLYIPALAWCGFALMGWLLATAGKPFDKPAVSA